MKNSAVNPSVPSDLSFLFFSITQRLRKGGYIALTFPTLDPPLQHSVWGYITLTFPTLDPPSSLCVGVYHIDVPHTAGLISAMGEDSGVLDISKTYRKNHATDCKCKHVLNDINFIFWSCIVISIWGLLRKL